MARGFRLPSGVSKLLVPVVVVGAIGAAIWYLGINPSTKIVNLSNLFGFLTPPPGANGTPPMGPVGPNMNMAPIPVDQQSPAYKGTGEFGTGYSTFSGAAQEDYGSDLEEDYDKINVSS
jgi:hypothetical protein